MTVPPARFHRTQIWNVNHFNELSEWQHLNQRNAGPNDGGPAMDAIAEQLAPAICANLKVVLQEVCACATRLRRPRQMLVASGACGSALLACLLGTRRAASGPGAS